MVNGDGVCTLALAPHRLCGRFSTLSAGAAAAARVYHVVFYDDPKLSRICKGLSAARGGVPNMDESPNRIEENYVKRGRESMLINNPLKIGNDRVSVIDVDNGLSDPDPHEVDKIIKWSDDCCFEHEGCSEDLGLWMK